MKSDFAGNKTNRTITHYKGYITEEQLAKYLSVQKVTKEPLLKILVDNGIIEEIEQAQLLAEQWGI